MEGHEIDISIIVEMSLVSSAPSGEFSQGGTIPVAGSIVIEREQKPDPLNSGDRSVAVPLDFCKDQVPILRT
jgi:hypothetical protein